MKQPVSFAFVGIFSSAIAGATLTESVRAEEWTLIAEFPNGKMFVQEASISSHAGVVTAHLRQEYARPLRTEFLSKAHWAINQVVRIRCDEDTWTTIRAIAFDQNNVVLKDETHDGITYFAIPKHAAIHEVTTLVCDHALRAAPLVVRPLG